MNEVIDGLRAALPTTLDIKSQGLFAIGYYHQRSALVAKRVNGDTERAASPPATPDETDAQ